MKKRFLIPIIFILSIAVAVYINVLIATLVGELFDDGGFLAGLTELIWSFFIGLGVISIIMIAIARRGMVKYKDSNYEKFVGFRFMFWFNSIISVVALIITIILFNM